VRGRLEQPGEERKRIRAKIKRKKKKGKLDTKEKRMSHLPRKGKKGNICPRNRVEKTQGEKKRGPIK